MVSQGFTHLLFRTRGPKGRSFYSDSRESPATHPSAYIGLSAYAPDAGVLKMAMAGRKARYNTPDRLPLRRLRLCGQIPYDMQYRGNLRNKSTESCLPPQSRCTCPGVIRREQGGNTSGLTHPLGPYLALYPMESPHTPILTPRGLLKARWHQVLRHHILLQVQGVGNSYKAYRGYRGNRDK